MKTQMYLCSVVFLFCSLGETKENCSGEPQGTFIRNSANVPCSKQLSQDFDLDWARNSASVPYSKEDDVLLKNSVNAPDSKENNKLLENSAKVSDLKEEFNEPLDNSANVLDSQEDNKLINENSANGPLSNENNVLIEHSASLPDSNNLLGNPASDTREVLLDVNDCQCGVRCSCPISCSCRQKKSVLSPTVKARGQSPPYQPNRLPIKSESAQLQNNAQVCNDGAQGAHDIPAIPSCCRANYLNPSDLEGTIYSEVVDSNDALSLTDNTAGLTDENVASPTSENTAVLTNENTAGLTDENTAGLTNKYTGALTDENSAVYTDENTAGLTNENNAGLRNENTGALTDKNTGALTDENTAVLTDENNADFTNKNSGSSDENNYENTAGLMIENATGLTGDIASLPDENTSNLTDENTASLTDEKDKGFTSDIASLSVPETEFLIKDTLESPDALSVKKDTVPTYNDEVFQGSSIKDKYPGENAEKLARNRITSRAKIEQDTSKMEKLNSKNNETPNRIVTENVDSNRLNNYNIDSSNMLGPKNFINGNSRTGLHSSRSSFMKSLDSKADVHATKFQFTDDMLDFDNANSLKFLDPGNIQSVNVLHVKNHMAPESFEPKIKDSMKAKSSRKLESRNALNSRKDPVNSEDPTINASDSTDTLDVENLRNSLDVQNVESKYSVNGIHPFFNTIEKNFRSSNTFESKNADPATSSDIKNIESIHSCRATNFVPARKMVVRTVDTESLSNTAAVGGKYPATFRFVSPREYEITRSRTNAFTDDYNEETRSKRDLLDTMETIEPQEDTRQADCY